MPPDRVQPSYSLYLEPRWCVASSQKDWRSSRALFRQVGASIRTYHLSSRHNIHFEGRHFTNPLLTKSSFALLFSPPAYAAPIFLTIGWLSEFVWWMATAAAAVTCAQIIVILAALWHPSRSCEAVTRSYSRDLLHWGLGLVLTVTFSQQYGQHSRLSCSAFLPSCQLRRRT